MPQQLPGRRKQLFVTRNSHRHARTRFKPCGMRCHAFYCTLVCAMTPQQVHRVLQQQLSACTRITPLSQKRL